MEKEIKVLKESQRGAYLITDGEHVTWIMRRSMRSNGTVTKTALEALKNGKTVEEWEADEKAWKDAKEKAKQEREEAFEKGKELTSVTVPSERIKNGSDKAWKIRTDYTQRLYGKIVPLYEYLPKSLVSMAKQGAETVLTMPLWFLNKHAWLKNIISNG